MAEVLILGGGFGGIAAANALRKALPQPHRITLVGNRPAFHVGATKTWVMLGERAPEQVTRPLDLLKQRGIDWRQAAVTQIDAANLSVETDAGPLRGDYLLIALGADTDMGAIPGLKEAAHQFYDMEGALRLRDELKRFTGGHILFLVPRAPFKCPPAPYEAAMLVHHDLKKRGIREKTRMSFYTVEGAPMATAGPEMGQYMRGELENREIAFHPQKRTKEVDAAGRKVLFEDGSDAAFDLLIAVPPHVAPPVVKESGLLAPSGWIPVDPATLRVTLPNVPDRVYAIGDVTVLPLPGRFKPDMPLVLPKAGVFAEAEAQVVAGNIAARILGRDPAESFHGRGFCYIEMGDRHAVRGDGEFFKLPHPVMTKRAPDLMQFEDKLRWVESYMAANLEPLGLI